MEIKAEDWGRIFEDSTRENSGISPDSNQWQYNGKDVDLSSLLERSSLSELEKAIQTADVDNSEIFDLIDQKLTPFLTDELTGSNQQAQLASILSVAFKRLSEAHQLSTNRDLEGRYAGNALGWVSVAANLDPQYKGALNNMKNAVTKGMYVGQKDDDGYTRNVLGVLDVMGNMRDSQDRKLDTSFRSVEAFRKNYESELVQLGSEAAIQYHTDEEELKKKDNSKMNLRAEDWYKIFEDSTHEKTGIPPADYPGEFSYKGERVDISSLLKGRSFAELEKAIQLSDADDTSIRDVIEGSLIPGLRNELGNSDQKALICSALSAAYKKLSDGENISQNQAGKYAGNALYWKAMAASLKPQDRAFGLDFDNMKKSITKEALLNTNANGAYLDGVVAGLDNYKETQYGGINLKIAQSSAVQLNEDYKSSLISETQKARKKEQNKTKLPFHGGNGGNDGM